MRTLLIDNHDSYTYNLFQLLATATGTEPDVVRNDETSYAALDLGRYDGVVISPGPGHPDRPADFGICRELLAAAPLPILGVCLGHQGIVAAEGGAVSRAPQARHGHLSRISHRGEGLFRGLPQGFVAVRYHSLHGAEPLPPSLVGQAWAEDGVLMGVAHRDRPVWGVQFHPESVSTEFGAELVANFRDLALAHRPAAPRPVRRAPAPAPPVPEPATHRLRVRTIGREVPAEAAFDTLYGASDEAFWLDSAHVEAGLSRFSYLGDASGPLGESVRYRVGDGAVHVTPARGPARSVPGTVFDYLGDRLGGIRVDGPELPFGFACGYVGYFGYELKADCGSPNRHTAPTPDARWLFCDRALVIDHELGRSHLLALDDGTPDGAAASGAWLDAAEHALRGVEAPGPGPGPAPRLPDPPPTAVEPYLDRGAPRYLADVAACRRELLAGESYEICLTDVATLPADGPGIDFYRGLRASNPAPYAAYLRLDEVEVACSSPERFLRIDGDGRVEAKPIKGTARRGRGPGEDAALRDRLTTDPKVRAENLMIADLLRNDLGQVCEIGSVHVPTLMAAETYTTVHQLVTTVRGRLRPGTGAVDCVRACFPGGSMTGAPKQRTMQIIDELEDRPRGVYSGAIGFLSCDGAADLNIVIRTAVRHEDRWYVGAGGAIVLDSDPAEEYAEMLLKAMAPLRAHLAADDPGPALRSA